MRTLAIIPARYASTRFEGKPLALLGGMPLIERVYRQVHSVVESVVVATDDQRIYDVVEGFGARAVMTSPNHQSGTDRCCEALGVVERELGESYDVVINVQGDEPFVSREQIETLIECFLRDSNIDIATLVKPFEPNDGYEALENPNSPKVVIDQDNRALYFSRSIIPYLRGVERGEWLSRHTFYRHIGMYGFRADTLREVSSLPPSSLELGESLEQLRWLECGYKIGVGITRQQSIGVDTPEDLERAEKFLSQWRG